MIKRIICIIVLAMFVVACDSTDKQQQAQQVEQKTLTVEETKLVTPLYFNGTIKPYKVHNITATIDGIIDAKFFTYGNPVKNEQKLFTIASAKIEEEFLTAISDYLKAVDDYTDKNRTYVGNEELMKLKFISENDYTSAKNARDQSYFAMRQSARKARATLEKLGVKIPYKKVDLSDRATIERIFQYRQSNIIIYSDTDGVALYPISGDSKAKEVNVGSEVKDGQIILTIGDLDGLAVDIEVSEMDINLIKVGQKATITGSAFPQYTLQGEVVEVDTQAKSGSSSQPTFPVTINATNLTKDQQSFIHVGMSAKVQIDLEEENVIQIPLAAINQSEGKTFVDVKDPTSGAVKPVQVKTGKTTADEIVISSGLKVGDVIVYSD